MEEYVQKIKEDTKKLLDLLGVDADVLVAKRDNVYHVNLNSESPALIIGKHGEVLDALQQVLRVLVFKNVEDVTPIVVDINGYRDKKNEKIESLARNSAYKVRETGKEVDLGNLNSYERRLVHMICSNIADVETESVGEGMDRRIVIKPKN